MSDIKDDGAAPNDPETEPTEDPETDAPAKPVTRPDHHTDPFHSTN